MDKERNGKEVFVLALLLNNGTIYKIHYTDIKQAEKQAEELFGEQEEKAVSILKFKNGSSVYIRKTSIDSISIYPKGKESFEFPNDGIEKKIHSLIEFNKELVKSNDKLIEIDREVAESNNKLGKITNDAIIEERNFQQSTLKTCTSIQKVIEKQERNQFNQERWIAALKSELRNIEINTRNR